MIRRGVSKFGGPLVAGLSPRYKPEFVVYKILGSSKIRGAIKIP